MASLNIGDFVWAKMKGFPAWPGKIVVPTDDLRKLQKTVDSKCVYFYGTHNHGWIENSAIHPFEEKKAQLMKLGKTKSNFKKSIEEIENEMGGIPTGLITTPSRQLSTPKMRKTTEPLDDTNNSSAFLSGDDQSPEKTTPVTKVPIAIPKRPTQKKKAAAPKPSDAEESPAKRPRTSQVKNAANHNNNNNDTEELEVKNSLLSPVPRARAARALIDRPEIFMKAEAAELDISTITETLRSKNITASTAKFGFIGLGIMGSGIVKNLLNSGHQVMVYNRTHEKVEKFRKAGAQVGMTPSDVVEYADITFSCVSDPDALQNTIFGPYGVSTLGPELARGKSYVEMTTIDTSSSKDIESALTDIGMSYLEAQIQGTKSQAEDGKLILLAAGDKTLFDSCQTCFEAMGRNSFFVGETGNATKMNLVLQTIAGIQIAGLADSIALAERAGLNTEQYLNILSATPMRSELIMEKGLAMVDSRFSNVNLPLMHMQKDLRLAINMADELNLPMPLAAIANEGYKNARRLGLAESDVSAICYRARH